MVLSCAVKNQNRLAVMVGEPFHFNAKDVTDHGRKEYLISWSAIDQTPLVNDGDRCNTTGDSAQIVARQHHGMS